jgi:ubiquitin-conjugating enzyme E2 D/E
MHPQRKRNHPHLQLLLSICSMLNDPNPHEAFNSEAANLYLNDWEKYNQTAREWTLIYASEW